MLREASRSLLTSSVGCGDGEQLVRSGPLYGLMQARTNNPALAGVPDRGASVRIPLKNGICAPQRALWTVWGPEKAVWGAQIPILSGTPMKILGETGRCSDGSAYCQRACAYRGLARWSVSPLQQSDGVKTSQQIRTAVTAPWLNWLVR